MKSKMKRPGEKFLSTTRSRSIKLGQELVRELFPISLATYLLLILAETIFKGSVSYYLDLNYLLIIVAVLGMAAVLTAPDKQETAKERQLNVKSVMILICAGVGGAAIIWYKSHEIGWISYVISAVGGGLIALLCLLTWRGDEEENEEDSRSS